MSVFYTSIYLVFWVHSVLALPSSNGTTGVEPIFIPDPQGRGTISLLSYTITLSLCIWTAVHPDVVPNKTTTGHLIYKGSWMILALFCPEIVVSNSYHQWREAKQLHEDWYKITQIERKSPEDMGMEGAFCVVMGGCAVAGVDQGDTATITPKGFLSLIQDDTLRGDVLKKGVIKDKGKADALAKLLVCAQALWMVVQCAARKINSLPVTLLEYHVVIQVAYAISMYRYWWHKSKDVNEQIEVIERSEMGDDQFEDCAKVVPDSKRFIMDDLISVGFDGHIDALTAAILGIPTSVLHVLAWNSHFPSLVEKWIWRVSSIGIGVAPLCMYLHFLASAHIVNYRWGYKNEDPLYRRVHGLVMDKFPVAEDTNNIIYSPLEMSLTQMIFYVTTWLNIHLYSAFSVLLGVVAFISLRSVPEGSYKTAAWSDYWPHL